MTNGDPFLVYLFKKNSRMQNVDDLANTLSAFNLAVLFWPLLYTV